VNIFDWLVLLWLVFLFGFVLGARYEARASEGSFFTTAPQEGSQHDES
jgi:hypothetical protein